MENLPGTGLPDWPETVTGRRCLGMLDRHLRSLRDGEAHGNRRLFLDDLVVAYLLAFFNPALRSLRALEDFSQTRQGRPYFAAAKLSRSTMSDLQRCTDPALLQPILARLHAAAASVPRPRPPSDLPAALGRVLAVDGTFFGIAADVAWAWRKRGGPRGKDRAAARLDVALDAVTWLPEVVDVAADRAGEAEQAARHVRPGAVHIYDRGIFSFGLIAAHEAAAAPFVVRLREPGPRTPRFAADAERPLTAADAAAGVASDEEGVLAGSEHRTAPTRRLRQVVIRIDETTVRLLTDLLDVEARVVGALYRWRWQVELFFRWLKVYARFGHLWSRSRGVVLLNFYVAVLGVLLMYLQTGARPSKYAYNLLGLVAGGGSTLEEITPILAERERQIALEKARLARKRAGPGTDQQPPS